MEFIFNPEVFRQLEAVKQMLRNAVPDLTWCNSLSSRDKLWTVCLGKLLLGFSYDRVLYVCTIRQ